jgi:glycosyltransferase involved in cell wall biosynthesis
MRKFLILSNSLSERADSVNAFELISIIREHLSEDCIVAFSSKVPPNPQRLEILKSLAVPYVAYSTRAELEEFSFRHQATHTIAFSGGGRRGLDYCSIDGQFRVNDNFHITQAVFKSSDFHGDLYLFVSEWLYKARPHKRKSRSQKNTVVDYLQHATPDSPCFSPLPEDLLDQIANRPFIARVGGRDQFSDKAAHKGIVRFLDTHPEFVFVAVNTDEFTSHPRVIYYPYLERGEIWDLYREASAALNGRRMGESFGYSIFEPLAVGTPVVAPHPIRNPLMDKNHSVVLSGSGLLYFGPRSLSQKLDLAIKSKWRNKVEVLRQVEAARRTSVAARFTSLLEKNGL